ncbi:MAG: hypothetical protein QOJ64_2743 [Acidobacteriota bacterium]|nr:hypothetical protein [Acidobacteriota bacterium]
MKNALTLLAILICACLATVSEPAELQITVRLTTGQHSMDSTSRMTTITVAGEAIVWKEQISGGHRAPTPQSRKEFILSTADRESLLTLIRAGNLLVTDSTEHSRGDGTSFGYFEIWVELTLDGEKGAINVSGPRTILPIKEEKLYRNTLALVRELYRIMHSQDKDVHFEESTF